MTALAAQILWSRLGALAREGAESFRRMAGSPLVVAEGQHACAILSGRGALLAQEQGEPSQTCALRDTVVHALDAFAFNLDEGDVLLSGDAWCGGTQGGTLTVAAPVFRHGALAHVAAVRFAAADLAGDIPGPFQPQAHEVWQESLRLTPVKLVRAGRVQKDVRAYVLRNTRARTLLQTDLTAALVTVAQLGGRLARLAAAEGDAALERAADFGIGYGRARTLAHLARTLPEAGTGSAAGRIDEAGEAVVRVALRRTDAGVELDFAGTAAQAAGAANLMPAATRAVALLQLAGPVIEDIGLSDGLIEAVSLRLPEGTLVNPAYPAASSLGWRQLAPLVAAALARAAGMDGPAIGPPSPLVMAFERIGTRPDTAPAALCPAFRPAGPGCVGGDAAQGRRLLISAEEAETAGAFRLRSRELAGGGIAAEVEVLRPGLEAVIVPGLDAPAPQISQSGPLRRERSEVLSLAAGATISFSFPAIAEVRHAGA